MLSQMTAMSNVNESTSKKEYNKINIPITDDPLE